MKTMSLASLAVLTCSVMSFAAPNESGVTKQLQVYPKNLARQHLGSNLFHFNRANESYVPTEAAAAWLDDDVTTGWPVMAGKQHYLLSLPEPQLLTNFSISTRPASGSVTLYVSDEPAPPGAKAWTAVARDVPIEQINQRKLDKSFSRFGKYVLIETDVADPGPLFSLYLYGNQPAVSYSIRDRGQEIDTRSIFGPHVNNQTAFNTAGLYSQSRVTYANSPDGFLSWQKAVDDNPESSVSLSPSTAETSAVVSYGAARSISRVAILSDAPANGRLDFYVVSRDASAIEAGDEAAEITPVSIPRGSAELEPGGPVSVEDLTPTASITLNGSNARASVDFAPVQGDQLLVRWTPDNASDSLTVRELNTFNDLSLANTELSLRPEMIAELGDGTRRRGGDHSKDGKSFVDGKNFKEPIASLDEEPEPVADITKSPYLPGALGFPPIITGRPNILSSPEPLSP